MAKDKPISPQLKKRRQLLLVLPLLMLPFVTLAFWAMGGGDGVSNESAQANELHTVSGINSVVPRAEIPDRPQDKMSVYAAAERQERAKIQSLGRFIYPKSKDTLKGGEGLINEQVERHGQSNQQFPASVRVEQKLAELQMILDAPGSSSALSIHPATYGLQPGEQAGSERAEQLSRLNRLSELVARSAGANVADGHEAGDQDADMQQINTMLDKILSIQHPDRMDENEQMLPEKSESKVYPLQLPAGRLDVPVLQIAAVAGKAGQFSKGQLNTHAVRPLQGDSNTLNSDVSTGNDGQALMGAFYDIDSEVAAESKPGYTVQAVIAASQTLVSGAAVKMRLAVDLFINGTKIPKGNFVYGTSSVNGERLKVSVSHIRFKSQIFPVHLTVYDLDGMEGIRIPGAIGRDASKEGADRALQGVQMMSLDPSITAQAAAAGIEATKGLLSKKVKLVRVTVKAGYPVLLLDEEQLRKQVK